MNDAPEPMPERLSAFGFCREVAKLQIKRLSVYRERRQMKNVPVPVLKLQTIAKQRENYAD